MLLWATADARCGRDFVLAVVGAAVTPCGATTLSGNVTTSIDMIVDAWLGVPEGWTTYKMVCDRQVSRGGPHHMPFGATREGKKVGRIHIRVSCNLIGRCNYVASPRGWRLRRLGKRLSRATMIERSYNSLTRSGKVRTGIWT